MKAELEGGPLDGGSAELPNGGTKKKSVLIVSAYCAVAHRFLDYEYEACAKPEGNKQKFKWKGQKN